MKTKEAASILGVELPIKFAELKSAFRRLAMFAHPDREGMRSTFGRSKARIGIYVMNRLRWLLTRLRRS